MAIDDLIRIMEALRGPQGCPWDREQSRDSLKPFLVEELYELLEALDEGDPDKVREELGDLLFQIVFHCQISKEMGQFDMNDVIDTISKKMISRHAHVFGNDKLETTEELLKRWDEHKKQEGKNRDSVLEGVPGTLPALLRAHRLQDKASRVGFDWAKIEDVFKKLDEELSEFRQALDKKEPEAIEEELGDIFFVLVRVSNFVGVNPEDALRKTISKFIHRFRHMEMRASERGRKLSDMTLEEMDIFWEEAKKESRNSDS
ncbi:MAG TPA: nucleoside triphosphate pyrophosphohydrolase [Nitrospirae bacterium]|nr:nucleoside triphosphate pyrophosphohydrolase/pyrophosphatase MazG [bacterium BMS3Abin10]GBE39435.1 nucleoside triphosphate pyrophosphohydrolase/pyrophosphatase MazG [bacterium BMS3Bbin08]HDH50739.1 nucleoside triphosphate pyrophosphohydrolase [Nitrospirota bacterium]HDK16803.1 nucleoside triphosphate pyrophosphohydrolase [Nitrospirota bacterium]HDK81720.1 nucleoside triphosphate pyrophosphohydrolase [Nitrospirota bacterium]